MRSACTVPRHADEQPSVVPEVGRPPILRVGHERMKVFDHSIQIKTLELLGVIELLTLGSERSDAGAGPSGSPDSATSRVRGAEAPWLNGHLDSLDVFLL